VVPAVPSGAGSPSWRDVGGGEPAGADDSSLNLRDWADEMWTGDTCHARGVPTWTRAKEPR
jgi:hypothetical protein